MIARKEKFNMKEITLTNIEEYQEKFYSNKQNKLLSDSIINNGINKTCFNSQVLTDNQNVFSIELPESKRLDQKKSGRCWAFAGINMIKHDIAKNLNIKPENIDLSVNYLTFYDKLEKSNTIYENIVSLEKYDFDTLNSLKILNLEEGGYFEYFRELVKKYGIIPSSYMPENATSEDSYSLMIIFNEKIKRDIYKLLEAKKKKTSIKAMEEMIETMVEENYIILSKMLGVPPTKILFEYKDKDNKIVSKELTPQEFYNCYCTLNLDDFIHVDSLKMYNKEYYKKYYGKYKDNILNKGVIEFINLPLVEFKELAIAQLKDNIPVWFGAEVKKMRNQEKGILDTNSYNYEDVFNFKMLNQEENLNLNAITLAHAMSLVGVHLVDNKPVRWKVENSWGDKDNKGYFIMNDNYFDEYVMEIVIKKDYLTEKQLELLNQEPIELGPEDPFYETRFTN